MFVAVQYHGLDRGGTFYNVDYIDSSEGHPACAGSRWYIYRPDLGDIEDGVEFNVLVINP